MRKNPTWRELRALFARSGNLCAYPECTHELIAEGNLFVAEVCHIRAASVGGPRYDPDQTEDERHSHPNLILLCHKHHVIIDADSLAYAQRVLAEMRETHESKFRGRYAPPHNILVEIAREIDKYWAEVKHTWQRREQQGIPTVPIRTRKTVYSLVKDAQASVRHIDSLQSNLNGRMQRLDDDIQAYLAQQGYDLCNWQAVPYYENPFHYRNYGELIYGLPNCVKRLTVHLLQIEIKALESQWYSCPDSLTEKRLAKAKERLMEMASRAVLME